jgi:hypothetical protein
MFSFSNLRSITGRASGRVQFSDLLGSHITLPRQRQLLKLDRVRDVPAVKTPFQSVNQATKNATLGMYSVRLVNRDYTGAIMNVRRTSDNATALLYSDNLGNLRTLEGINVGAWANGATVEILTWYDQSGGGRHANAGASRAPRLVLDPAGGIDRYCVHFPNGSASTANGYHGFTIAAQAVAAAIFTIYPIANASLWHSILCTNVDNSLRFYNNQLLRGDANDFMNSSGGFGINNNVTSASSPFVTLTNATWQTICASKASGTMPMIHIGNCEPSIGYLLERSFNGYMTEIITFGAPLYTVGLATGTMSPDYRIFYNPLGNTGLVGNYTADSFTGNQWRDISGAGNHVTTVNGTINVVTQSNSEIVGKFLTGNTNASLVWPNTILPNNNYTLFHITKYNGTNKGRILTANNTNWLSGFHGNRSGVAHHNKWIQSPTGADPVDLHGSSWVLSSDQLNLYRSQQVTRSVTTGISPVGAPISVNSASAVYPTEKSDWAIAHIMVYNRVLPPSEYLSIETMLAQQYKLNLGATSNISPIRTGLTLELDPVNGASGTTLLDRSGNGYDMTFTSGTYVGGAVPYINCTGSTSVISRGAVTPYATYNTVIAFTSMITSASGYRTLLRGDSHHHVLTNTATNNLGLWNGAFVGLTPNLDISTLPGVYTRFNMWAFHLSTVTPFLQVYFNPGKLPLSPIGSITSLGTIINEGIRYIGNNAGGGQPWGNIGNVMIYHRRLADEELVEIYQRYMNLYKLPRVMSIAGNHVTTITLSNNGAALANWPIKVTLPYKSSYAANYQNLRFFVDGTMINHWYESVTNSSTAAVWLQVPSLANGTFVDVYSGFASSPGNGKSVFPLFDDFSSGSTIDTNTWTVGGNISVSNSTLVQSDGVFAYISSKQTQSQLGIGQDVVVESRLMSQSANAIPEIAIRSSIANNTGIKGRMDCRGGNLLGMGGILNNPYNTWNLLRNPNTTGMSTNVAHIFKFTGVGNTFSCFLNDVQQSSSFTSSLAAYNNDGSIAIMNHGAGPVIFYWVRAYKYTAQAVSGSAT